MNGTNCQNLFTIKNTHKIMSKIKKDFKNKIKMSGMNFSILLAILAKDKKLRKIITIRIKINILTDK